MFNWLISALSFRDLPAWLQAFAAIVALGISVWATLWATGAERRKDRLKVQGIAVAVYPELLKLEPTFDGIEQQLERLKGENSRTVYQSAAATLLNCQIPIPPMIERNIDTLFLLGEPGGATCLQLVSLILQYNSLVEPIAQRMVIMDMAQWIEGMDHLKAHINLLRRVAEKAQAEVKPLHDAIAG
jgi:hypothetical protein